MLRKDIGFIFQDYGLIENETVEQNLLLVDKIKKDKNLALGRFCASFLS